MVDCRVQFSGVPLRESPSLLVKKGFFFFFTEIENVVGAVQVSSRRNILLAVGTDCVFIYSVSVFNNMCVGGAFVERESAEAAALQVSGRLKYYWPSVPSGEGNQPTANTQYYPALLEATRLSKCRRFDDM